MKLIRIENTVVDFELVTSFHKVLKSHPEDAMKIEEYVQICQRGGVPPILVKVDFDKLVLKVNAHSKIHT